MGPQDSYEKTAAITTGLAILMAGLLIVIIQVSNVGSALAYIDGDKPTDLNAHLLSLNSPNENYGAAEHNATSQPEITSLSS